VGDQYRILFLQQALDALDQGLALTRGILGPRDTAG
jgi:hypothetical protein